MTKNNKIKLYSQLFQALSLYMRIDFQDCKDWMLLYLKDKNLNVRNSDMEKRVDKWWYESQIIQEKYLVDLDGFFKKLADERQKIWKSKWITTPLKGFELDSDDEEDAALDKVVQKILEPVVKARLFRDVYKDATLFKTMVEAYCHKYFYIYRVHSKGKVFVRDLLRIQRCDELGNIFCNLYQYTDHEFPEQKYKEVRVYSGNVYFNTNVLDINLVCDNWVADQGLRYCNMILPRIKENKFRNGVMTSLSDHGNNPAAAIIVYSRARIEHPIKDEDMKEHVKRLSEEEEELYHPDILSEIGKENQYIEAKNLE
jgi:hypothetical protein